MKELSLKEIQQASYEVLVKLTDILDAHGWKYYLAYGTLIGAIRHKGFIPWDDDIDINMPRKDYEEFVEFCINHSDELKPFELFHYKTSSEYIYALSRFSNSEYKVDYNYKKDYGLGVFVDIYPLDNITENDVGLYKRILRNNFLIETCGCAKFYPKGSILRKIIKYPYWLFMSKFVNLSNLIKRSDSLSKTNMNAETDYVANLCWSFEPEPYYFRKEWFGNGVLHEFNGKMFRIPENYNEVLKPEYGDYMKLPPEKDRIARHNYKVYKL